MTLPPREIGRRLDQQAHDIEDAYSLITELRTETAEGFARVAAQISDVENSLGGLDGRLGGVENRLNGVDGRLGGVENCLDHQGQLLERILYLLDKPGT